MTKIAIGSRDEAAQPDCLKALVVEFITTFLFVFAGVGSAMAADKLTGDALLGLFAVAVAHALVVAATISGGHISGGHLNPAVTIGLLFGGHITVVRSILYWIIQLLASTTACLLLKYLTGGLATPVHTLASGMGYLQGVGANILAGGAFSGASMNPARSFGPALVSWDWTDHWVYWVGPLIGGGLAGFIYEHFFITRSHRPLPSEEESF
ncbi:AQUAPORIN-8 [Salix koriyanagi]|uniref:AQUAPORIN-8 n=1 Tax=Salix koriyanagi TaxID=2511006 RepID=A0A9Q0VC34_9ROSI|nr:AQUAPORIN-8 [Salix koriyanagi]